MGYLPNAKETQFFTQSGEHLITVKMGHHKPMSLLLNCSMPNAIIKLECGLTAKGVIFGSIGKGDKYYLEVTPAVKTYDSKKDLGAKIGPVFAFLLLIFYLWLRYFSHSDWYKKIVYPQEYWKDKVESLMMQRQITQEMHGGLLQDLLIEHARDYSDKTETLYSATNSAFSEQYKELNEQLKHAMQKAREHGYDGEFIPLNYRLEQTIEQLRNRSNSNRK